MATLKFNFTTQYPGSYYALVHNEQNAFINNTKFTVSAVIDNINNFCIPLIKKDLNTYIADVISDNLESGIYTFRIYQKNSANYDISKDDLVSVGQTGWNKNLQVQENANDILSSIEAYEARQENIYRIDILLDSVQLGLRNGETGFARIDFDTLTSSLKIKAFWRLNAGVKPNRISIRGPSSLGQRAKILVGYTLPSSINEITLNNKINSNVANAILSKSFYITIDTSVDNNGRIGGYPIYTPAPTTTATGSVSFSVQPSNASTGVSFRTS